jgi:hypothetical protein
MARIFIVLLRRIKPDLPDAVTVDSQEYVIKNIIERVEHDRQIDS